MERRFATFILSHGRADRVYTLDTLKKCGYTGDWYILVDDEDPTVDDYIKNFGKDKIIIFSKDEVEKEFDPVDHLPKRGVIFYARNQCWKTARDLNLTHFWELDDDYTEFRTRYEDGDLLRAKLITNLDAVIEAYLDFLDNTNILTVAFAQGGDLIGGIDSFLWKNGFKRKAMNSFFCRVDRPFEFVGRINEDVNAYCMYGQRGGIMITFRDVTLNQVTTQKNAGGMSDTYLDGGTYVKSFYSVITNPSCVKIGVVGPTNFRYHHSVKWDNCCPKIMSDKFKK